MYQIFYTKKARKDLAVLPKKVYKKFVENFDIIAKNPYLPNNNIKALKGLDNLYRLRVGDYRAVYSIYKKELIVEVIKIAHRKEVYK